MASRRFDDSYRSLGVRNRMKDTDWPDARLFREPTSKEVEGASVLAWPPALEAKIARILNAPAPSAPSQAATL